MKKEREFEIGEAIKYLYATEPLAIELASAVTERLFKIQKQKLLTIENFLCIATILVVAISVTFFIVLRWGLSMPQVLLISGTLFSLAWVSLVELSILSKYAGDLYPR